MLLVQEKIIHLDIIREHFVCNLNSCKGACCWEGDFGAPIEKYEKKQISEIMPLLLPLLSQQARHKIEKDGLWKYYPELESDGTPLLDNGACTYLIWNKKDIAQCGFELLHDQGISDFKKPISCHLYPIRINTEKEISFEALNYDKWSICSAACSLGKKLEVPLYRFCKEAIIRKYGQDFYDELDEIAQALTERDPESTV